MRHRKAFRKFGRTAEHREAMFANMAMALIEQGRIKTTDAKAKELRRVAEKLVTLGKAGTLAARRRVYAQLKAPGKHPKVVTSDDGRTRAQKVVDTLFNDLAQRFKERPGGYTRIIKIGNRKGDNAPVSFIEFVDYEAPAVGGSDD
ncbi:MAG: 50S ribosomal protein L17 [Myxococcota bacterium]